MNWYLTKLIFRIISGDGSHAPQFDEQLRLIQAVNEQEAFQKASVIGQQEETSFLNDKQQTVRWQFINLSELHKLSALEDGTELYSTIQEQEHAGSFIEVINKRAAWLKKTFHTGIFNEPQLVKQ